MPAYADYLAGLLRNAGCAPEDVVVRPVGATATLTARYRGTGAKRPMLLSGHMDVVEADPKDWERDPFTMVEDKGYLFGRGVEDNKFDVSMMVATLIRLKAEGFRPARDIVLVLSGDEETTFDSTQTLADAHRDAELLLNSDGGGGTLGQDGAPIAYGVQAGEKTYADFDIIFTNPGGHSSAPTRDNAITDMAAAATRIGAYRFPVQSNELTRASFASEAKKTPGALGEAMRRFAANPDDSAAAATIAAEPWLVGQLGTTCVSTMANAGHARNALPQRAVLGINCRIFPGVPVESVRRTLETVIANPQAKVVLAGKTYESDASPLRPDVMAAVGKAVAASRGKEVPIQPSMSSGATDSVIFRAAGIPSYGVSGLFQKPEDGFAHGLNERVPVRAIAPALTHWHVLITELAR